MNIVWPAAAIVDLLRFHPLEAKAIDLAVQNWARQGVGFVVPGDEGAFLLVVDVLGGSVIVKFFWDDNDDTIHIESVRRATTPKGFGERDDGDDEPPDAA